jgi:glutathione-regulated potassium-efflux system ancillary protein KefC
VLSVALLQDMAAIPILALVPLLAAQGMPGGRGRLAGRGQDRGRDRRHRARRPPAAAPGAALDRRSDTPEIFTAASLLLVVAIAALMQSVGLSMALGAFLAGVLLAESEYRRELETDIEPFKGLLLGLFFIAVGMSIDFGVVLARRRWWPAVVLGFLLLKALVLWAMARTMPVPLAERPVFVVLLARAASSASWSSRPRGRGRDRRETASLLVARWPCRCC